MGLLLAIVCSLCVGYAVADWQGRRELPRILRRVARRVQGRSPSLVDTHYYKALTSLLNEQPDEALDRFVSSMEVTPESLEVHLALGALLRRRGEFDRALRVHQNLLEQPELSEERKQHIQLELACDYWRSGLLDRAVDLLKELIALPHINKGARWQASAYLVEIYQEMGDWLEAVDVADTLTSAKFAREPDLWRRLQAQFCCELAQRKLQHAEPLNSETAANIAAKLRQALSYDPNCVRASLLQAELALLRDAKKEALNALKSVPVQDARLIPDALPLLAECMADAELHGAHLALLKQWFDESPSLALMLAIAECMQEQEGESATRRFCLDALPRIAAIRFEVPVLMLTLSGAGSPGFSERFQQVATLLEHFVYYQCDQCGIKMQQLEWRCPGCHSWGTVAQVSEPAPRSES